MTTATKELTTEQRSRIVGLLEKAGAPVNLTAEVRDGADMDRVMGIVSGLMSPGNFMPGTLTYSDPSAIGEAYELMVCYRLRAQG